MPRLRTHAAAEQVREVQVGHLPTGVQPMQVGDVHQTMYRAQTAPMKSPTGEENNDNWPCDAGSV